MRALHNLINFQSASSLYDDRQSFHLKTLQQTGLLDCRHEGRQLIYQTRCDVIIALMAI